MPFRKRRIPRIGKPLAGLLGFVLLGQTALGQAAGDDDFPDSSAERVPRVAQTPQSPSRPPYSGSSEGQAPGSQFDTPGQFATPNAPPASGAFTPPPGDGSAMAPGAPGTAPAATSPFAGAFAPGAGLAGGGATTAVADNAGYIDSAIIRTRIRLRYDSAYDLNTPDKAEFFYAKCGCFANPMNFLGPGGTFNLQQAAKMGYDPRARGPQHPIVPGRPFSQTFKGDPSINYQEFATYLEYAPIKNFSTFVEVPVRFINPTFVRNNYGFSDINAGIKYAFVAEPDAYYTFQFRGYAPTGASDRGLGTGHVSLEPALLVFQRLSERVYFSGEFRDWIPVDGSNFAGNILRYGAGLTYNMVLTDHFRIAPVNEVVGWTILGGKELDPKADPNANQVHSVAGDTIVNEKIGVRIGLGDYSNPGGGSALNDRHSFYIGYGRALTGDHWYRDTLRVEYNLWF